MKQEITIPSNHCPGCVDRDEIIRSLANRVDELEGRKPEFTIIPMTGETETQILTVGGSN